MNAPNAMNHTSHTHSHTLSPLCSTGGKPGAFPALSGPDSPLPHPVPFNLYDPFGLSKNASPEKKAKGLKVRTRV